MIGEGGRGRGGGGGGGSEKETLYSKKKLQRRLYYLIDI
jgi:hypothetical protein